MPVVMDHHGLRVDMRLERLERVAERRQLERPVGRAGLGEGDLRDGEAAGCRESGRAEQELQAFASVHGVGSL